MTREEFEKAQREKVWLFHTKCGLVQAIHSNSNGWAWVDWRGEKYLVYYMGHLRLATAQDLLKEAP